MRHAGGDGAGAAAEAELAEAPARGSPQAREPLRRVPETKAVRLGRLDRQRDIALRGKAAEDAGDLERAREPKPRPRRGRKRGDVAALEKDSAACQARARR